MSGVPQVRADIDALTQLISDMEAQAALMRYDPARQPRADLVPMVAPVLSMFEACRMMLTAANLLLMVEPKDRDGWQRIQNLITEALGRVITLDTLWQTTLREE